MCQASISRSDMVILSSRCCVAADDDDEQDFYGISSLDRRRGARIHLDQMESTIQKTTTKVHCERIVTYSTDTPKQFVFIADNKSAKVVCRERANTMMTAPETTNERPIEFQLKCRT